MKMSFITPLAVPPPRAQRFFFELTSEAPEVPLNPIRGLEDSGLNVEEGGI